MSEPPSLEEPGLIAGDEFKYDFAQAERILKAMDFLRGEAGRTHIDEIVTMVDATFSLLVTTYHCILRYEMTKLPASEPVQ
jgi:hypothetical protein